MLLIEWKKLPEIVPNFICYENNKFLLWRKGSSTRGMYSVKSVGLICLVKHKTHTDINYHWEMEKHKNEVTVHKGQHCDD